MAITPVPAMTDTPPFPALADRAAGTYNGKAYAFGAHMSDTFNDELVAVAENVLSNAVDAAASAAAAETGASVALAASGATTWIPNQVYDLNATVLSPANQIAYRKRTPASASGLDPSVDPTNWRTMEEAGLFTSHRLAEAYAVALSL